MRILEDIKNPEYWIKVLQLGTIFFVIFVGLSLIISHFRQIVSGDFAAIYQDEFSDGKWVEYFLIKLVISLVYAMYMTSRRRNFRPQ
ncbi:MAG: hypothetical protein R3209_01745 [Salinimicrobium sediminis]|uniref:Uncharacterized protein n=1 Tax=Salinimicrobium sediminis TaxID=1343891 RepID=A0A285X078_9FLAO|nr:hypothetical protein [Salinimicrobium sediminis]MDX1601765.1 hypothetical protein [Salinimicrobium sediminis]SOC78781.1 hypothetical protein SAMN06296241_0297 [Salinimicrobium sediminis]